MPQNLPKLYLYAPQTPDLNGFSGDRTFLKLFTRLFQDLGFQVICPSSFAAKDSEGHPEFQRESVLKAGVEVASILKTLPRPDLFVTYHHYYKAPDLLGPALVKAWNCPYVIIESSHAPKRAEGPWSLYYRKTLEAFEAATVLLSINPDDAPMLLASPYAAKVKQVKPFMPPLSSIELTKAETAQKHGLNMNVPWLLVVAQMRTRHKLSSYEFLADVMEQIKGDYELLIIGDGEAKPQIRSRFNKAHFLGVIPQPTLFSYYAAANILPWPGLHEAIGMCYLEAQAYGGVPVMMEISGGKHVVESGKTGLVARDAAEYAQLLQGLIDNPVQCKTMGEAARQYVAHVHGWEGALEEMRGLVGVLCSC